MTEKQQPSWYLEEKEDLSRSGDWETFRRVTAEWEERSWHWWLRNNLRFPFPVERTEGEGGAYCTDNARLVPFRLGNVMWKPWVLKAKTITMELS